MKDTIYITCTWLNDDGSSIKDYTFSTKIKNSSNIRKILRNELQRKGIPLDAYDTFLRIDKNTDRNFSYVHYGMRRNGNVIYLDFEKSLQYEWKYGEIKRLYKQKYIDGNIKHLHMDAPIGMGAAGGPGVDPIEIASIMQTFAPPLFYVFKKTATNLYIRYAIRRLRKNGFTDRRKIREVIDIKGEWTINQMWKCFGVNDETSIKWLLGLGYSLKGNYWTFDKNNPDSLKARSKWLEEESKNKTQPE